MSGQGGSEDPFEGIIRANTWDDLPGDDEDLEPWAEDVEWIPANQPEREVPSELHDEAEDPDDVYAPDPGPITSGVSPGMLRALSTVTGVLVVLAGLAALPGRLPGVVWALGLAALVGALYTVFRALPEESPEDDDGAVL